MPGPGVRIAGRRHAARHRRPRRRVPPHRAELTRSARSGGDARRGRPRLAGRRLRRHAAAVLGRTLDGAAVTSERAALPNGTAALRAHALARDLSVVHDLVACAGRSGWDCRPRCAGPSRGGPAGTGTASRSSATAPGLTGRLGRVSRWLRPAPSGRARRRGSGRTRRGRRAGTWCASRAPFANRSDSPRFYPQAAGLTPRTAPGDAHGKEAATRDPVPAGYSASQSSSAGMRAAVSS